MADTDTIESICEKAQLDLSDEHEQTDKVTQRQSCNDIDETVSILPTETNQNIFPKSSACSIILEKANSAKHKLNKEKTDFIVRSGKA